MSDNKFIMYTIKNLIKGNLEETFCTNRIEEAKIRFAEFMEDKESGAYNLYAIGRVERVNQMLVWTGIEAKYKNELKVKRNEKKYYQTNFELIENKNKNYKENNRKVTEENIERLFYGRKV